MAAGPDTALRRLRDLYIAGVRVAARKAAIEQGDRIGSPER